jgi:uncharacterized protein YndB with AHSA1/START domain
MPSGIQHSHANTHAAARFIPAPPRKIFQALLDPHAVAIWQPPAGMTVEIIQFEPHPGGVIHMALRYTGDHPGPGKTSEHADVVKGQFVEIVPDLRTVQRITFESDDPAFAEAMMITTSLAPKPGGTEVSIRCENVPEAISESDHIEGIASTLKNLAAYVERSRS